MGSGGTLNLTTRGDRELVITRVFDAPRALVFDAFTKPELIRRWLLGPEGWEMTVCEFEPRANGTYRYEWRHRNGNQMGMGGVIMEVKAPERLVTTEKFDESWYPGEAVGTLVLTEQDGKTTLTHTVRYESRAALEAVLKSPMESGLAAGYARLDQWLATVRAKGGK